MTAPRLPTPEELDARPESVRVLGEITPLMIQRFAATVGDDNPLYLDAGHARAAGYRNIVAPPTFVAAVLGWEAGPGEQALMEDGSDAALVIPETIGYRFVGGGQSLTFFEPLCAGDVVRARKRLAEVYERDARSGTLTFLVFETVFETDHGTPLVRCRETLIARP
jgi:acyl dehydratase